ncbi:hypothetical protein [Ammoniphilus sp. CFH 90114]|uniref:hypothetical protein n=1 Tax=Ammoniphilus sp. CFH 90114 TaxID=2493665 RepID=UPI00100EAF9F|nr:hypothetical protein [Ammoniphilus sp. CFH 90114]RXT03559.1 hypothetical protein EIZ39_23800 [Ammoniphilus sp. CFH 90114]
MKSYIQELLTPRLASYDIPEKAIKVVTEDVEDRLTSIIRRWGDLEFRQTMLITAEEEAYFYRPAVSLDVRSLVSLAIRNSRIEDLASTTRAAKTLWCDDTVLTDDDIIKLTEEAIVHFKTVNLNKESKQIEAKENDPYGHIPLQYPVAWAALNKLAMNSRSISKYEPIKAEPFDIEIPSSRQMDFKKKIHVISGMDPAIDEEFAKILYYVTDGNGMFFSDSFKMITRHPEKLFKILEFVLRRKSKVVTFNFYLENGIVARRKKYIRPGHFGDEIPQKLKIVNGLVNIHRQALDEMKEQQLVH